MGYINPINRNSHIGTDLLLGFFFNASLFMWLFKKVFNVNVTSNFVPILEF